MPLGTEIGLAPGHIVLDGDPAPLAPKRGTAAPYLSAHVLWPNDRLSWQLLSSCFLHDTAVVGKMITKNPLYHLQAFVQ